MVIVSGRKFKRRPTFIDLKHGLFNTQVTYTQVTHKAHNLTLATLHDCHTNVIVNLDNYLGKHVSDCAESGS